MNRITLPLILLALFAPLSVQAADQGIRHRHVKHLSHHRHAAARQFPLTRRARDIRKADACWHGCQVKAGRVFQACLHAFPTTACAPAHDAIGRYCLRECRISGGPLVDWTE